MGLIDLKTLLNPVAPMDPHKCLHMLYSKDKLTVRMKQYRIWLKTQTRDVQILHYPYTTLSTAIRVENVPGAFLWGPTSTTKYKRFGI